LNTTFFIGPTISAEEVCSVLPAAEIRGPVACGDILRAAIGEPGVLGIVDGLFEHTLPVWHKEILWALDKGWRVYGSSSMGALRAAELARFGMVGVGQIFAWYRDGILEDDDEVAVAHEQASTAYRARSDAMVNVRATLERAVAAGVLDAAAAATLATTLKATPYAQRNLRRALAECEIAALPRAAFTAWLDQHGPFDLKRMDALALVRRIADDQRVAGNERVPFDFSYTETFHELVRSVGAPATAHPPPHQEPAPEPVSDDELFEELQLCGPGPYAECWQAALEKSLLRALSGRGSDEVAREEAMSELPDVLRALGLFEPLASRARAKSQLLAAEARPAVRIEPAQLLAWYFSRLDLRMPQDLDRYARAVGFADEHALLLAIARERWYLDHSQA